MRETLTDCPACGAANDIPDAVSLVLAMSDRPPYPWTCRSCDARLMLCPTPTGPVAFADAVTDRSLHTNATAAPIGPVRVGVTADTPRGQYGQQAKTTIGDDRSCPCPVCGTDVDMARLAFDGCLRPDFEVTCPMCDQVLVVHDVILTAVVWLRRREP